MINTISTTTELRGSPSTQLSKEQARSFALLESAMMRYFGDAVNDVHSHLYGGEKEIQHGSVTFSYDYYRNHAKEDLQRFLDSYKEQCAEGSDLGLEDLRRYSPFKYVTALIGGKEISLNRYLTTCWTIHGGSNDGKRRGLYGRSMHAHTMELLLEEYCQITLQREVVLSSDYFDEHGVSDLARFYYSYCGKQGTKEDLRAIAAHCLKKASIDIQGETFSTLRYLSHFGRAKGIVVPSGVSKPHYLFDQFKWLYFGYQKKPHISKDHFSSSLKEDLQSFATLYREQYGTTDITGPLCLSTTRKMLRLKIVIDQFEYSFFEYLSSYASHVMDIVDKRGSIWKKEALLHMKASLVDAKPVKKLDLEYFQNNAQRDIDAYVRAYNHSKGGNTSVSFKDFTCSEKYMKVKILIGVEELTFSRYLSALFKALGGKRSASNVWRTDMLKLLREEYLPSSYNRVKKERKEQQQSVNYSKTEFNRAYFEEHAVADGILFLRSCKESIGKQLDHVGQFATSRKYLQLTIIIDGEVVSFGRYLAMYYRAYFGKVDSKQSKHFTIAKDDWAQRYFDVSPYDTIQGLDEAYFRTYAKQDLERHIRRTKGMSDSRELGMNDVYQFKINRQHTMRVGRNHNIVTSLTAYLSFFYRTIVKGSILDRYWQSKALFELKKFCYNLEDSWRTFDREEFSTCITQDAAVFLDAFRSAYPAEQSITINDFTCSSKFLTLRVVVNGKFLTLEAYLSRFAKVFYKDGISGKAYGTIMRKWKQLVLEQENSEVAGELAPLISEFDL